MRTITKELFKFSELSESAQENARSWYRDHALEYEWWDCVYEDFKAICHILGVDIGSARGRDEIYFSGFSCQGDGASFAGAYSYAAGSVQKIKEYAPLDKDLHSIAENLAGIQKKYFYRLEGAVSQSGRYYHECSMSFSLDSWRYSDCPNLPDDVSDIEDTIQDLLRDLASWLYQRLENEYDYLLSDESIDDSIHANEYEFFKNGSIYY